MEKKKYNQQFGFKRNECNDCTYSVRVNKIIDFTNSKSLRTNWGKKKS